MSVVLSGASCAFSWPKRFMPIRVIRVSISRANFSLYTSAFFPSHPVHPVHPVQRSGSFSCFQNRGVQQPQRGSDSGSSQSPKPPCLRGKTGAKLVAGAPNMEEQPAAPTPLSGSRRTRMNRRDKFLIALGLIPALCIGAIIMLRVLGLVRPFTMPTGSMTPAVSAGDHFMMEDISYVFHRPCRGDIVVFKTDGISMLPPKQIYIKRVVGLPGDHVRISDGKLFINDVQITLSNAVGAIVYDPPLDPVRASAKNDATVPSGSYFVVGDNSSNSFDSRFWGSLPGGNIMGRAFYCYWPPGRRGHVK